MTAKPLTYAGVGVDVGIEAKAAKLLYQASRRTWSNRAGELGEVILPYNDFAGLRYIKVDRLPGGTVLFGGSDGVATKALIASLANRYDTLGFDLMAMVCDDAVIRGGEPVLVKSVLDINTLGQDESRLPYIKQLAKGYVQAAKSAGVAVINGELAQLGEQLGSLKRFRLSWSADVTWFAHKSRLLTGQDIKPGDSVIALRETGPRTNGITLLRKVLETKHGPKWGNAKLDKHTLADLALQPARIYTPAILDLTGGYSLKRKPQTVIHGASHITGGGIPEKLGRLLRVSDKGAILDNLFTPGKLLQHCQKAGNISDQEAYGAWNMGQGMLIVTPEPAKVLEVMNQHKIQAQIAGQIVSKPGIELVSRGTETPGKLLRF